MYTFPRYVTRPPLLACTSKIPDGDDEVARVLCEHTGECRVTGDGGGELKLIVSFGTFGRRPSNSRYRMHRLLWLPWCLVRGIQRHCTSQSRVVNGSHSQEPEGDIEEEEEGDKGDG